MEKFSQIKINPTLIDESENKAKFIIQPLQKGFGTTLGNSLRRVCLSSIPGVSVFAIKIPGVTHEFQAIDGVYEDVVQIILNLKRLVIRGNEEIISSEELNSKTIEAWPVMKIHFNGEGEVTAADIEAPAGFEIINKDLHIATITKNINFSMELYAKWGHGFNTYDENKENINLLSIIPTDSNFSPVLAVNWNVKEVKTSKLVTSDVLEIEIATNGAVKASEALIMGAKILFDHLQPLIDLNPNIRLLQTLNDDTPPTPRSNLYIPIEDLDLTVRAYNALKSSGILSTQELLEKNKHEIEKIKNLGRKSVNEIIEKIHERGLKLRDE